MTLYGDSSALFKLYVVEPKTDDFRDAGRRFDEDWPNLVSVTPDPGLLDVAARLAEQHGLRALDSIHLASFQQVLECTDDEVEFWSFDDRLNRAAKKLR